MAVVGNVSSGKSSLINAILMRHRNNAVADVGATSGVTTELNILRLNDERVRLIDSPGLGDIRKENSAVTKEFLKHIDIGILVVTGSADASQKQYFDDLRANCTRVFLVLNKCDQWDNYKSQALEDVKEQWKQCLGVDKIYAVCALGYDKQLPNNFSLDIRGVNELREDIEVFLELEGKKLLLARHMGDKKSYAQGIIVTAVTAVGVQALLPGKAFYSGIELTKKDTTGILKDKFNEYRNRVGTILKRLGMTDIRNLGSLNFKDIIDGLF
ncbi:MAG: GTPase [Pseudanabaena sp.]